METKIFSPLANSTFFQLLKVNDFEDTMFVDKRTFVVCSYNKKIIMLLFVTLGICLD